MASSPRRSLLRFAGYVALASFLGICRLPRASAQAVVSEDAKTKLGASVRLAAGTTTVGQVTDALSQQTGLKIEAADYLRDHMLTMHMTNVSAATVLNTFTELYGWQWSETEDKRILLNHSSLKTPRQITDIPKALEAALPKDFRRFLGMETPLSSSPFYQASVRMAADSFPRTLGFDMYKELALQVRPGEMIPYDHLSASRKHDLLVLLVLDAMEEIERGGDRDLFRGYTQPFDYDLSKAHFTLKNGMFMVGITQYEGTGRHEYAFGAPLHDLAGGKEINPDQLKD